MPVLDSLRRSLFGDDTRTFLCEACGGDFSSVDDGSPTACPFCESTDVRPRG